MSLFTNRGRHSAPSKMTTSVRATALMAAAGGIAATAAASNNTAVAATGNASLSAPVQSVKAATAPEQARPALAQTPTAAPQLNVVYAKRLVVQQQVQRPAQQAQQSQRQQVSRSTERPQLRSTQQRSTRSTQGSTTRTTTPIKRTTAPKTTPVESTPATGGIVSIAQRYIGVPYVFGGSSPAGFDCSGLTQYVYAQAGISIPRTASAQVAAMRHVSNPQPGDLVYFGSPAHHIGIYVGGGKMIAAPYPGQNVRLQPIWDTPTGYLRA